LSFALGALIGRWLKTVSLTEEERVWRPTRRADEQVPGPEGRGGFDEHLHECSIRNGRENASMRSGSVLFATVGAWLVRLIGGGGGI
jgi:hypothetical protein